MSILTRSTASKLQTGYTADRYQAVNTMMRRYNAKPSQHIPMVQSSDGNIDIGFSSVIISISITNTS